MRSSLSLQVYNTIGTFFIVDNNLACLTNVQVKGAVLYKEKLGYIKMRNNVFHYALKPVFSEQKSTLIASQ